MTDKWRPSLMLKYVYQPVTIEINASERIIKSEAIPSEVCKATLMPDDGKKETNIDKKSLETMWGLNLVCWRQTFIVPKDWWLNTMGASDNETENFKSRDSLCLPCSGPYHKTWELDKIPLEGIILILSHQTLRQRPIWAQQTVAI